MSGERYESGEGPTVPSDYIGSRRRDLLHQLDARGGSCGLATLTRALAETSGGEVTAAQTRQLYPRLHDDVREMASAGLVDYCEEVGTVELTARGRTRLAEEW
jgi:hypothetical protein